MRKHDIQFESIDLNDCDLSEISSIKFLKERIPEFTHIVLLAAKLGRDLFNKNPEPNAEYNKRIFYNVTQSIVELNYEKNYWCDFTFYSTSEVYGSLKSKYDTIHCDSELNIRCFGRGLYAKQKHDAEVWLKNRVGHDGFRRVKILRPFNVSGFGQKRGVIYDMVKSALTNHEIWFSKDTYRSFTSDEQAAKLAYSEIVSTYADYVEANISEHLTFSMEDVAIMVRDEIGDETIRIVKRNPDNEIQYRQTSRPDEMKDKDIHKMKDIIRHVLQDVETELHS